MIQVKRTFSLLLALVLCMGLLPQTVFAAAPYEGDHQGSVSVTVRDAIADTPLADVMVQLEDITAGREQNYGTQRTDANGRITWTNLSSGWYRVTQTAVPEGIILNSAPIVRYYDAEQDAALDIEMSNRQKHTLYIYRINPDTQAGLADASYIIRDMHGAEVAKGVTDGKGYLVVPNLTAGDYMVEEVKAPTGHNITTPAAQRVTLTETDDNPFVAIFTGNALSSITIFNYDAASGEPIPGSIWRIESTDGVYQNERLVTNAAGYVTQSGLAPGTYIITQTEVGTGYMKQLKSATVVIGQETIHRVVSLNNVRQGTVTVHAADAGTGKDLPGVAFTLRNERNEVVQGPSVTNAAGIVTFNDVPDGRYTVTATAPSGYAMNVTSQAVQMTQGGERRVDFTATQKGSILISAMNEATGRMLPGCYVIRETAVPGS